MALEVPLLPAQSAQSRGGTCSPAAQGTSMHRQTLFWVEVPIMPLLGWAEKSQGRRKAPKVLHRREK